MNNHNKLSQNHQQQEQHAGRIVALRRRPDRSTRWYRAQSSKKHHRSATPGGSSLVETHFRIVGVCLKNRNGLAARETTGLSRNHAGGKEGRVN
jgi:hypothetical protein